jgi:hypothetical protein
MNGDSRGADPHLSTIPPLPRRRRTLYVTLSGPELVSLPIDAEPLPLYPVKR